MKFNGTVCKPLAAAALLGAIWVSPFAVAAQQAASVLDLTGFAGKLRLVNGASGAPRATTPGWTLMDKDGALTLKPPEQRRQYTSAIQSSCDSATNPTSALSVMGSGAPANALEANEIVEVAIPARTRVLARGFAGSLESKVALFDPELKVTTGAVSLAQVLGGELAVVGAGSISIDQAAGKLKIAVAGPGKVEIAGGRIDELNATVEDAGLLRHDGSARRATLAASGISQIRVRQVEQPVRVDQAGFAAVSIRCKGTACDPR